MQQVFVFETGMEGLLAGQDLDGVVSLGIVQMVSGRSGCISMYAPWNCFSLCWGLSKTHLEAFSWWKEERKDGSWVVWTALVNHMVFFLNLLEYEIFFIHCFRFHFGTFPLHFGLGRFLRYYASGLVWNREPWGLGAGSLNLVLGNRLQELEKRPS